MGTWLCACNLNCLHQWYNKYYNKWHNLNYLESTPLWITINFYEGIFCKEINSKLISFLKCQIKKCISIVFPRNFHKVVGTFKTFSEKLKTNNFFLENQLKFTQKGQFYNEKIFDEYSRILRSNTNRSRMYSILKCQFRIAPKESNVHRIPGFRIFGYTTIQNRLKTSLFKKEKSFSQKPKLELQLLW